MELEVLTFRHQVPAQLRFSDVDQFGHVNNSVYFQLFDTCKSQYLFDVVGKDIYERLAIVVANINANFLAPIFYPDQIAIHTSIVHLGRKSFTLVQRAVNTRTQDVKCECRTIMVCFDTASNKSIPIPEDFRMMVDAYENGAGDID